MNVVFKERWRIILLGGVGVVGADVVVCDEGVVLPFSTPRKIAKMIVVIRNTAIRRASHLL